MVSLSYIYSSVLFVFPFLAALITTLTVGNMPQGERGYGDWLALFFLISVGITLGRILYKRLRFAYVVEAARKWKIGKGKIDTSFTDKREDDWTILTVLKFIFNLPGWIVSTYFFPMGSYGYFIGLLLNTIIFVVSVIVTAGGLDPTGDGVKDAGYAILTILVVIASFFFTRYISSRGNYRILESLEEK